MNSRYSTQRRRELELEERGKFEKSGGKLSRPLKRVVEAPRGNSAAVPAGLRRRDLHSK